MSTGVLAMANEISHYPTRRILEIAERLQSPFMEKGEKAHIISNELRYMLEGTELEDMGGKYAVSVSRQLEDTIAANTVCGTEFGDDRNWVAHLLQTYAARFNDRIRAEFGTNKASEIEAAPRVRYPRRRLFTADL